ncbi:MAG: hypothetical protein H6734_15035 [Alphaproteobacteria bacterium]|nr:hypothetical protein [Alphaproteobacteria bacterium]
MADALATVCDDPRSREVALEGLRLFGQLFGSRVGSGVEMVVRTTDLLLDEAEVRVSCDLLARSLVDAIRRRGSVA